MNEEEVLQARGKKGLRRHRKQRARRGWSVYDAWSSEGHILGMIGEIALYYRGLRFGHPGGTTEEEWNDILTRIGEPLIEFRDRQFDCDNLEQEKALYEKARKALKLFTKWHGAFWI